VPIRVVVSQISPPIRILLVLAVAVLGVYMLFLRPKPVELPPAEPATTQPAQVETTPEAVDSAAGTAAGTKKDAQGGKAQGAAPAEPAEDLKGMPKPVRQAIRKDKVLVVLFSNGKSYDDKAVEKALSKVNRWDGRVYVHTAPLRQISKYGRIARGVNVEQSPTVVVADRDLRAETLVGYVDRATIDQAVVDARRNAEGVYVDSYLKAADKVCFAHSNRWDSVPFVYTSASRRQIDRRLAELDVVMASFVADYAAIKPSAKWRSFHKATVADMKIISADLHRLSGAVTAKTKKSVTLKRVAGYETTSAASGTQIMRRFKGANLPRCGAQF
jgi:hypothetical protein